MNKTELPKSRAKTAYGLLSEIRKLILAEPKRYHQGRFIARRGELTEFDSAIKMPACGTVGCVAGWVATLKHGVPFRYEETEHIAASILGLNATERDELFDGGALASVYAKPQTKSYAKAGAAHISWFQQQYAKQLKAKAL